MSARVVLQDADHNVTHLKVTDFSVGRFERGALVVAVEGVVPLLSAYQAVELLLEQKPGTGWSAITCKAALLALVLRIKGGADPITEMDALAALFIRHVRTLEARLEAEGL